jgi:hypothetical protein
MPLPGSSSRYALVACALLSSCAPAPAVTAPLPMVPGVYPRELSPGEAMAPPRRAEGWEPAADAEVTIDVDAPADAFLRGLPPTGTALPVRPGSWPAAVRLSNVGPAGAALTGDAVSPRTLAADIRCDAGDGDKPVRLVAEVVEHGPGLRVQVRYEGPEPAACELSSLGRRRLQGALADVYLWARGVAWSGSEIPTAYR